MVNLVIVDDEKLAVDTLYEILLGREELELQLFKAYSGAETLNLLEKTRIDIVISDVRMPGINGMELHKIIVKRWPRCRVIFLSGFDNIEYAQAAMRNNAIDYIIKTDRQETIFNAVKRAVEQLSNEERNEELLEYARRTFEENLPVLQKEYIRDIFCGVPSDFAERQQRFREFGIPLDPMHPVLLLAGRVDNWGAKNIVERKLDLCRIQNIAGEYLADGFVFASSSSPANEPVWLLQPRGEDDENPECNRVWDKATVTLQNTLDMIQSACSRHTRLRLSFAFSGKPCPWQGVAAKYDELTSMFINMSFNTCSEMILNDEAAGEKAPQRNERYDIALFTIRHALKSVPLLEDYLENGRLAEFNACFTGIMSTISESQEAFPSLSVEAYYSIALMFRSCINKIYVPYEFAKKADLGKLMSMEEHNSWKEIEAYFKRLAAVVVDFRNSNSNERTSHIIIKIKNHILNNLDKDLSVISLAELVYFNQSYLSRLFKQETGDSLTSYIIRARINKAKELLCTDGRKVNEIAPMLGFSSHAAFTRFFKRYAGVSPQDYRSK